MSQKSSQRSCCFVASQTNNMAFAAEWQPCSNQSLQHGKGTECYELLFERVMDSTRIAAVSFRSKKRTKKKQHKKTFWIYWTFTLHIQGQKNWLLLIYKFRYLLSWEYLLSHNAVLPESYKGIIIVLLTPIEIGLFSKNLPSSSFFFPSSRNLARKITLKVDSFCNEIVIQKQWDTPF